MLKLKNVIRQLEETDYQKLTTNFNQTKANKYAMLLECMRDNNIPDQKIMETLNVKVNAYYTLKSRLYDTYSIHLTSPNPT